MGGAYATAGDSDAARSFLKFCKSESVRQIIKTSGYDLPELQPH